MKKSHLRIAILGLEDFTAGGAHTAENLMLDQIRKSSPNCEVIVYDSNFQGNKLQKLINRLIRKLQFLQALHTHTPLFWRFRLRYPLKKGSYIERKLEKLGVDLVIFVGIYEEALLLNRIPYVVTIWDLGHREFTYLPEMSNQGAFEWREWQIEKLAKRAVRVLVDSESTKNNLMSHYSILEKSILVLPFALQQNFIKETNNRESFAFYPAHFWSHKNHTILVKAIKHLVDNGHIPRRLVLTGLDKGAKAHIDQLAADLGVTGFIDYKGFLSKSEIQSLYLKASITVMPSILGPTNLPPLESLLNGCPVAVTSAGSWGLTSFNGVLILDAFDISAWAKVLDSSYDLPIVEIAAVESRLEDVRETNHKILKDFFYEFKTLQSLYK